MDTVGAQSLPLEGYIQWVFAEDGLLIVITLIETNAFAVS
jgi:hypothetical protein